MIPSQLPDITGAPETLTYTGKSAAIPPPIVTLENSGEFDGPIRYSYAKDGGRFTGGLPAGAEVPDGGNYTITYADATLTVTPLSIMNYTVDFNRQGGSAAASSPTQVFLPVFIKSPSI